MYTSVTVVPLVNPNMAMDPSGANDVNVQNGTAEVVAGQEYVLVYTKNSAGGKLVKEPTPGVQYRITGSGGLNVIGIYLDQPEGNPHPLRFKVSD